MLLIFSDFCVEKTVLGLFKALCKNIHSERDVPALINSQSISSDLGHDF